MGVIAMIEGRMIVRRGVIVVRDRRIRRPVDVNNRVVTIEVCVWRRQQPGERHRESGDGGEAARS